ncbi:AbrB family transcriptional regulator [Terrihabitans rhizophilus]|uniref:AbrB family transcriptional regulator n=1 Tax=Terrihabitans rhizophilus TaxID=3092662 RepID=A0ABU4RPM7_9HYPH|nr:AbrB family transcriptional regulator [Terrihabitans sp. PJ23]MDX6806817.1 AbrB family transcriptional regulator [Terrihabitans sp. PJ23]
MLRMLAGLLLGALSGLIFHAVGIPLPWLLGPLIACAIASLAGAELKQPPLLRKIGQAVAAVAIGLAFSPAVVESLAGYLHIMVLAAALSMIGGVMVARLVSVFARTSFETAYFSSLPGGVAEMSVLAERYGGETALVALAQSLRIIFVVLIIPPLLVALSSDADFSGASAGALVHAPALIVMLVLAGALAVAFDRLRIMNAWFLAGLAVGASVAILQIPASHVPVWMIDVAQVLIGCALGSRIDRGIIIRLRHFLPATVAGTFGMMLLNVGIAWLVSLWTGFDLSGLVLATAPGGVAEMSITAGALHLAVPLVTAFHLVRVLMIILLSAPLYRGVAWLRGRIPARQPAE